MVVTTILIIVYVHQYLLVDSTIYLYQVNIQLFKVTNLIVASNNYMVAVFVNEIGERTH